MTIILRDEDLQADWVMPTAVEAVEEAFRARVRGALVSPPRHGVEFGDLGSLVFTIGGTTDEDPLVGFRVYETFGKGPESQLVAVWSADDSSLRGIVLGERLGDVRTGAIGGVAVRHLSAPDAGTLGLIGTGKQARTQLEAAASVRRLREVRVFSRDAANREAFVAEMGARLKLSIRAARSARDAVDGADIVICATVSETPVIEAGWLRPGVHVTTVGPKFAGRHEVGLDLVERAAAIVTDSPQQTRAYGVPFFLEGTPHDDRMVELADIASGRAVGRGDAEDTTLFVSSGLAGTEVLVASRILDRLG